MIRRIFRDNDYKDIIVDYPRKIVSKITGIKYFIEGYEDKSIDAEYSIKNACITAILSTQKLSSLPTGVLYRKISYVIEDPVYPDGKMNKDIIASTDVWLCGDENDDPGYEYLTAGDLKTINGENIVGEGDIVIESGGVTPEEVEEIVDGKLEGYVKSEDIPAPEDIATKEDIPSLEGLATESWVEGKGYLTEHQPLKTINNQSLIGTGNIDIQGGGGGDIQPGNVGQVYGTSGLSSYTIKGLEGFNSAEYKISFFDGNAYLVDYPIIHKYNPDTMSFEEFVRMKDYIDAFYTQVFFDKLGRMYVIKCNEYVFHYIVDGRIEWTKNINGIDYYNTYHKNLIKIDDDIFLIRDQYNDAFIFDEDTQDFVLYPFRNERTRSSYSFYRGHFIYKGHIIFGSGDGMNEVAKEEEAIVVKDFTPDFDIETPNTGYVYARGIFDLKGELFYIDQYEIFKLVDGHWINISSNFSDIAYMHEPNILPFEEQGYAIYISSYINQGFFINPLEESYIKATWYNPSSLDIISSKVNNQNIGEKKFSNLTGINIYVGEINANNPNLKIRGTELTISADKSINLGNNTFIGGSPAATKDDLYINKSVEYPGMMKRVVYDGSMSSQHQSWISFQGKSYYLLFDQKVVFDGQNVYYHNEWCNSESLGNQAVYSAWNCGDQRLFIRCDTGNLYEVVGDETILRMSDCPSSLFPYKNTLIDSDSGMKLNTDTWEWEDFTGQPVSGYYTQHHKFVIDGETYMPTDGILFKFNPDSSSFEHYKDNPDNYWSNGNSFVYNNYLYVNANSNWYKTSIYGPWERVDIYNSADYRGYIVADGKTFTFNEVDNIVESLDASYDEPELTDNSGYLKATKNEDGKIVYTWDNPGGGGGEGKKKFTLTSVYDNEGNIVSILENDVLRSCIDFLLNENFNDADIYITSDDGITSCLITDIVLDEIYKEDLFLTGYLHFSYNGVIKKWYFECEGYDIYANQVYNDPTYLTEHQDLSDYALKSEIPSLEGYATESWVEGKGYLTEHQSLDNYLNKTFTGTNTLAGKLQVGDATTNVNNAYLHIRNVGTATLTGSKVNGACFAVNSDGTTGFFHKSYTDDGSSAKNDAILRFSSNGIQFAKKPGGNVAESDYKDVAMKEDIPSVWTGSQAQWDLLTDEQKSSYTIALITE